MGKRDIGHKTLAELNDVFADIVNVLLFQGKHLMKEEELEDANPRSNYHANGKVREQQRDVAKFWRKYKVRIALVGLEHQTKEDTDMPIRMIGYDGAAYRNQITHSRKKNHERYPVVSLVLYFGHKHRWRAPKRLRECFDIEEALKPYVSDYKINLFEIAYLSDKQVRQFKSDFRIVADYFVQMRRHKDYTPSRETVKHVDELLTLMRAVTEDDRYEEVQIDLKKSKYRRVTMCEVLDKVEARGVEKGLQKGLQKGKTEGKMEGKMGVLFDLVRDGVLTVNDAAARAGVSVSTFSRKLKAYNG